MTHNQAFAILKFFFFFSSWERLEDGIVQRKINLPESLVALTHVLVNIFSASGVNWHNKSVYEWRATPARL